MKISLKLNVTVFVVMAAFLVSIGFLIWSVANAQQLHSLSNSAQTAIRETNTTMHRAQQLLTEQESLQNAYEAYREQRLAAQEAMETLVRHPGWEGLPEQLQSRAERSLGVRNSVGTRLDEAEEGVERILETDIPGVVSKNGILRLHMRIQQLESVDMQMYNDVIDVQNTIDRAIATGEDSVTDRLSGLVDSVTAAAAAQIQRNLTIALVITTVALAGGIAFLLRFSRRLTRRIQALNNTTNRLAERDFTVSAEVSGGDELGALANDLNRVISSTSGFFAAVQVAVRQAEKLQHELNASHEQSATALNEITTNIEKIEQRFSSLNRNISSSAEHISSINMSIDNLTEHIRAQTDEVANVSSSIEEITANVNSVSRLSDDRKRTVDEVSETVREGADRITDTNEIIRSVSRDIDDILEIIELINNVSEQTHLLSMNAAIESAHAGESGKGFAVVAEEIRKLAESTSENAARIERNLRDITDKVREALQSSDLSAQSFYGIRQEVTGLSSALVEIHQSMRELSAGSNDVLTSISALTETTEQTDKDTKEMTERIHEIGEAINTAADSSEEVSGRVQEIQRGSREILDRMVARSETATESKQRMQEVQELLDTFRIFETQVETLESVDECGIQLLDAESVAES